MGIFTKNKKGIMQLENIMYIIGVIVAIGVGLLFAGTIISKFNDSIQAQNSTTVTEQSKEISTNFDNKMISGIDVVTILILIISLIVLSIFIRKSVFNTIHIFIILVVLIILPFIGYIFKLIWDTLATQSTFAETIVKIPLTNFLLSNLPIVLLIYSFILGVVLFTRE